MHTVTRTSCLAAAAAIAGLALSSGSAHATLVAAESFLDGGGTPDPLLGQYKTDDFGGLGSPLAPQDPTVLGFTGTWAPTGSSNSNIGWVNTVNFFSRATGLDPGFGYEQPGSMNYLNTPNNGFTRHSQRELIDYTQITPTSTWYMSSFMNTGNDLGASPNDPSDPTSGRKGFFYTGFTNDLSDGRLILDPDNLPPVQPTVGNLFGAVWGFEYDAANSEFDLVIRHRQDVGGGNIKPASNVIIDGVVTFDGQGGSTGDNETYSFFLKVDAVAGGADTITYWINPDASETTEQGFTDTALATGSLQSFGFNSDANNWNDQDPDLNRFVTTTRDWNGALSADELRLATTFESLLGLSSQPLDGDYNLDGFVGIDDLNIVLVNWNQNVPPGDLGLGDGNGDGFVGVDDLNIVLVNWNNGTPPVNAVPEPATLALIGLGGLATLGRRR